MWRPKLMKIPTADEALPGRHEPLNVTDKHHINGNSITGECPLGCSELMVGMGCFWGAERLFWSLPGVYSTSVGYGGGHTPNPTYDEVCSGMTGHTELVRIWYDPKVITLTALLRVFWEQHDPTQGMRQGNDIGTQYRSAIYVSNEADLKVVEETREHYQKRLKEAGRETITTDIQAPVTYYLAETYHQQYLAKNPNGYCGLNGCSVGYE
ncbi:MAG: peptide-methionine (S)-S-oxide reductase MsrA [Oleibacter sp.]|nr:peptide-methionine (S)-S-oxide reductase MsrA [Thalassolituus sp.]